MPYEGKMYLNSKEEFDEFINNAYFIDSEERVKVQSKVEKQESIQFPMEVYVGLTDEKWGEVAKEYPKSIKFFREQCDVEEVDELSDEVTETIEDVEEDGEDDNDSSLF